MKTLSIIAVALLATSGFADEITGQIFIVTNAHQSIKLGLVPVAVYDDRALAAIVKEVQRSWLIEGNGFIDTVDKPIRELGERASKFHRAVAAKSPWGSPAYIASQRLRDECSALEGDALAYLGYVLSSKRLFEHLSQPLAETKSDADGNFTIVVADPTHAVLAATTTRTVFDKQESYHWLIRLSQVHGKLMLSNDNLASTNSAQNFDHWPEAAVVIPDRRAIEVRLHRLQQRVESEITRAGMHLP